MCIRDRAQVSGQTGTNSLLGLKIIGVYETVEAERQSQSSSSQTANFNPAGNAFYAPLSVVQKLSSTPGYVELGSYYFDSVGDTTALKATFKTETKGTSSKYQFATDPVSYTHLRA